MITFLGDVALIAGNLKSSYQPQSPYIFNCEYVIGEKGASAPTQGKINLCSDQCNFAEIFGSNPAAVSIVNNHIFDYGDQGFESTVAKLQAENIGLIHQEPFNLSDHICLLAYMDLGKDDHFSFDYDAVAQDISKIKANNSAAQIIVQIHWGIENHPSASKRQREVGHWLIDLGVDLVIGHHPHCIQPIEQYKGKYICYSLGNGLFGNINLPSHFDCNGIANRVYRIKWHPWNRRSLAIRYDEVNHTIAVDELYQKNNTLFCKKKNAELGKYSALPKGSNLIYAFRKYFLFFVSNAFVDGKLFDLSALKHELRRRR